MILGRNNIISKLIGDIMKEYMLTFLIEIFFYRNPKIEIWPKNEMLSVP